MKGFSLIEILMYVSLLLILFMGVISSVFILIDKNQDTRTIESDSIRLITTLYE